jgi:hypothetical protein
MALVDELGKKFGNNSFDALDVVCVTDRFPDLVQAIDAEVPRARYKPRRQLPGFDGRGPLNVNAIRVALRKQKRMKANLKAVGGGWTFCIPWGEPRAWPSRDDTGACWR